MFSLKHTIISAGLFAIGMMSAAIADDQVHADANKIVSVGGSVTEIIYALGAQDRLIARDSTSTYPEVAKELPDVGYMRRLAPEGVLSVEPDLIISEAGSGPQETIDVLKEAGIPFVTVPDGFDREAIITKIHAVGKTLGLDDKAAALAEKVNAEIQAAEDAAEAKAGDNKKRVMFVLSTREGRIMASGAGTAADGIIKMAGGVNAVEGFYGYKQLSDEAVALAAPEVIVMMARGSHSTKAEELFALPAMVTTPAADSQRLVMMNGLYLLGFGPRTSGAVADLNKELYGE